MTTGLEIIAQSIWKAQNKADPTNDPLAAHVMEQEALALRPEASGVVKALYDRGHALVASELKQSTIEDILKAITRVRDSEMLTTVHERLRALYSVGLSKRIELDSPEIKAVLAQALVNEIAQRRPGISFDIWDRRHFERAIQLIAEDLKASGYQLAPKAAPEDLIETMLKSAKGSSLALVFGEDPRVIAGLYHAMVERQRAA